MKNFIKIIALILALCALALAITAIAKPSLFDNNKKDDVIDIPSDDTETPEEPTGPKVYEGFTFNGDQLVSYTGSDSEIVIPASYSINEDSQFIEGDDYEVKSIESNAIYENDTVTKVILPSSLRQISYQGIAYCDNLIEIDFSNCVNLTSLSRYSLCYNPSLKNIDLGNCVNFSSMSSFVFSNCGLESIDLSKCTKLTSLGSSVFSNCTKLTKVLLPDTLTSLGGSTFSNCENLIDIKLPNITSLEGNLFNGCKSLTNIIIPSSVTSVGSTVFQGCTNLKSITFESIVPPTLGNTNAFSYALETIYVPADSVEAYKIAELWSEFAEKIVGFYNVTYSEEDLSNYQGITKYLISASEGGTFNSLVKCIYMSNGEVYILSDCTSKIGENYLYQIKCVIDPNLEGLTLSSLIDKLKSSAVDTEVIK